jgi:DNA adenine methylase
MIGPLAYIGGKNRLASKIIEFFPEHQTYVEPFCGGAQVFFRKAPSKVEILNDLNEDIFNFLRVCQLHHEESDELPRCARMQFSVLPAAD